MKVSKQNLTSLSTYNNGAFWKRFIPGLMKDTHVMASFSGEPERYTILDVNEPRGNWVAMASAGPYANHMHFAPDIQPHQHLIT